MLGERTAGVIKMAAGPAYLSPDEEPHAQIRGRYLVRGLPKTMVICGGGPVRDQRTG
jgi:rod shape-determining protein MreB and related proteins